MSGEQNATHVEQGSSASGAVTAPSTGSRTTALIVRFTKFDSVSQIPKEFIKREFELKGKVHSVLPSGTLKVEHIPIIRVPKILRRRADLKEQLLNVRIAGLNVTDAGRQFLENDLRIQGRKILFTALKTSNGRDPAVDAEVTLQKNPFMHTNVNVELIRRGYAKVLSLDDAEHQKTLREVPPYSRLVSKLLMSEKIADRRGVGIWQRESWVESIAAYPSQFSQIIRHSALARFMVLTCMITRDLVKVIFRLAEQGYYLLLVLLEYLLYAGKLCANAIDKSYIMYNRLRQKFIK